MEQHLQTSQKVKIYQKEKVKRKRRERRERKEEKGGGRQQKKEKGRARGGSRSSWRPSVVRGVCGRTFPARRVVPLASLAKKLADVANGHVRVKAGMRSGSTAKVRLTPAEIVTLDEPKEKA